MLKIVVQLCVFFFLNDMRIVFAEFQTDKIWVVFIISFFVPALRLKCTVLWSVLKDQAFSGFLGSPAVILGQVHGLRVCVDVS